MSNKDYYAASAKEIPNVAGLPEHDEIKKNPGQPYYLVCRNRRVVARVWIDPGSATVAVPVHPVVMHDTDSGLGIGGINNDQSMPIIPTVRAIERVQRMADTDTICRRCGASKNFDGAMFSTLAGSGICDDCA